MAQLAQWATDPELTALDPPAGVVHDPMIWSIYTDDGMFIGMASLYNREGTSAELGIRIGNKSYWGQGHGKHAVQQVVEYGWQLGLSKIHLKVVPTNTRAIRCYEACGFEKMGYETISGILFLLMELKHELLP
jgi:RimJ/RimL family protein N-acetyltransferase